MRQLILIRHAKSSWDNPKLDDFERPLNKRGKRDAPFMANLLLGKDIIPELIISSPALRTKLTTLEFAEKLKIKEENIIWDKNLYLASSDKILKIIHSLKDKVKCVILVGHNPGLTELQNFLCKEEIDNIPTCGIVGMLTDKNWSMVNAKDFDLQFFEYPKKYLKKS